MSEFTLSWWVFKIKIKRKIKRMLSKRDSETGLKYELIDGEKIYFVDTYNEFLKLPKDIGKKAEEIFGDEIFLMKEKARSR